MRASRSPWPSALVLAATLGLPAAAQAQLQASEKFTLTQVIDGAEIVIEGARPSVRGRTIFGDQVPWNRSWTPGARLATTLAVSRDFSLNGVAIPAGKYSVWVVPRQDDRWSLILDPRERLGHGAHPDSTADQHHVSLQARTIPPMETLTWSIGDLMGFRATLGLAWADKAVDMALRITPRFSPLVTAEVAARYVGEYATTPGENPDGPGVRPPTRASGIAITYDGRMLHWRWTGEGSERFNPAVPYVLIPRNAELFTYGYTRQGELVQEFDSLMFEFTLVDGRATSFEVRSRPADRLLYGGIRK